MPHRGLICDEGEAKVADALRAEEHRLLATAVRGEAGIAPGKDKGSAHGGCEWKDPAGAFDTEGQAALLHSRE